MISGCIFGNLSEFSFLTEGQIEARRNHSVDKIKHRTLYSGFCLAHMTQ